jgi:hypothetical protein
MATTIIIDQKDVRTIGSKPTAQWVTRGAIQDLLAPAKILRPHPGAQTRFMADGSDVALWIGGPGVGKTTALLLDAACYANLPGWQGVFFRNQYADVVGPSGPWARAKELFGGAAVFREATMEMTWPSGATLRFASSDGAESRHAGHEYAWIGIDQCHDVSARVVHFLGTRLRTTCGVKPIMRLAGSEAPTGWNGKILEALTRSEWPGPGASWFGLSRRGLLDEWFFGPTRVDVAEACACPPEQVRSLGLITGR